MGRVAVVTGGASGMGLATARRLAAHGDRVGILDIDGDAAERGRGRHPGRRGRGGRGAGRRVGPGVGRRRARRASAPTYGPILVMVTSAGIAPFERFLEITPESWQRTIDVNLTGTFHCLQAVIPDMVAAGWGRIVTISSSSAQQGAPRMVHYSGSKGGVIAMTRSLAKEFGGKGITVNTVPPSMIDTPMSRQSQQDGDLPDTEFLAARIPVGRVGTGEDIAAAVAFLCSDDAGYITGQTFGVNGGGVM